MILTEQQKLICKQVVNVFETGKLQGDYAALAIFADGPNKARQITYGRTQTTEYGNLKKLVELYTTSRGMFSNALRPYLTKIGVVPLVDDPVFKQLLIDAGKKDAVMHQAQDKFFEQLYFKPALDWGKANGFKLPLSALVIYDSKIHSGSVPDFLCKRCLEYLPKNGGDEKIWVRQYVDARYAWLATHSNAVLQRTVYRMACFKQEMGRNNWYLTLLPITANKVIIKG